ncbi:antigen-presenting glycoprotein CD1d-like isoform X3 [Pelodiscus sinensis]|uniref:antigen-presenting glycoprotein CD1d-like isoform X3 n=1 Tax=Pelodiscus sinensis TaxID=13735 RepID=UPI003F6CA68B
MALGSGGRYFRLQELGEGEGLSLGQALALAARNPSSALPLLPGWLGPDWLGAGSCPDWSEQKETNERSCQGGVCPGAEPRAGGCLGPTSHCPETHSSVGFPARMLLPLLLLPWAWGALAASPPLPTESLALRLLLTSLFPNASAVTVAAKVLLGDLETHALDSRTGAIRFLQPWAQEGLSPREWQDLEQVAAQSLADFVRTVTEIAREQGIDYPFVAQASIGCELRPNGPSRGFYDIAGNGQAVVSFDEEAGTWVARSADGLARYTQDLLNRDWSTSTRLQYFLKISCIYVLQTFARHGNASLARRERPIAVVFAREPPPTGPPASLLLVCRVTGFYPRTVHVAWLQDGEEVGPGRQLDSTGTLPNADLTYQLRSSLAVGPGDGHSYTCWVEHSSLGGQSLLIPWGSTRTSDQPQVTPAQVWGPAPLLGIWSLWQDQGLAPGRRAPQMGLDQSNARTGPWGPAGILLQLGHWGHTGHVDASWGG